jgi:thiol-disulfide isomerase/thioredoxin
VEPTQNGLQESPTKIADRVLPDAPLRRLDGSVTNLTALKGRRSVLLFWNPQCGYCQQMLPELKAIEADNSRRAPRIVLISTGSTAENRSLGLRSTILLDDSFATGFSVGATGTPAAAAIDAQGRVVSGVAAGVPEVLSLLRSRRAVSPLKA